MLEINGTPVISVLIHCICSVIVKVALSSQSQSSLMCYGIAKVEEKMLQGQILKECCENIEQMTKDFGAMSEELNVTKSQLSSNMLCFKRCG